MSSPSATVHLHFPATWQAEVLTGPPLISPARQYTLPQQVPGEEKALARGALWLQVRPRVGGTCLLQCALGFAGGGVLGGVWSTPDPDTLLAAAGGYCYHVNTADPVGSTLLPVRPVVRAIAVQDPASLVLVGFHGACVLQAGGTWATPRLSWEGVTVTGEEGGVLRGLGWHMRSDRELPFALDLRTRELTGGAFLP